LKIGNYLWTIDFKGGTFSTMVLMVLNIWQHSKSSESLISRKVSTRRVRAPKKSVEIDGNYKAEAEIFPQNIK
jgi:hypothetical protein